MTDVSASAAAGAQLDLENPWPGLDSYAESSHDFFSGRATEADDLHRRILDEPLTVLFGKSGLGKSSLLKAGVFPRLREKGLLPIFLRLQVRQGAESPIEQARLAVFHELRAQGVEHPDARHGETLWEYLHRTGLEFWTRENRLVRPVLVFDQFEEIFTLGRAMPAAIDAFREDLSDLVENRIPGAFSPQLEQRAASELGLDVQARPYKVVLSLREDFLADLEEWRLTMPSLRRNRMRLLPMGPEQAMQAVCNERTRHLVAEPLARTIVGFLASGGATADGDGRSERAGSTVEPALLSLFCRGVNEQRKRDGKDRFDDALVEGAKGTIVTDFYRTSLADQPDRVRRFIEEQLITEHGFRNSYSVSDALALGSVTKPELDTLVNRHLLRHEHHLGTDRIELTHDLLTIAVADERDRRRLAERRERERRQRRRLLLRFGGGFAVAALIPLALVIDARRDGDRSRSRELAALADQAMNQDPELAVVLAREALLRADTAEARTALLDAAQYAWPWAPLALEKEGLQGAPNALALNRDGSRLAVLVGGNAIGVWDVSSREPSLVWKNLKLEGAFSLAFSPDQSLLAVGRSTSIAMLDARTGNDTHLTAIVDKHLGDAVERRQIAFSPDGQWLASTHSDGRLRLLDYRNDRTAPPAPTEGLLQFAIAEGGNRIVVVSGSPLSAYALDLDLRNGSWTPTKLDLSRCMNPQSVSPGLEYSSATWKTRSCTFQTSTLNFSSLFVSQLEVSDTTDDIVWSPGGRAYAELLASEDVIVGRVNLPSFRIKGGRPNTAETDKSRSVSVSETGTRVALIDQDKTVRVYSLADHKPFLSRFRRDSFTISPDGSWVAVSGDSSDDEPAIDVISLEGVSASELPSRRRIDVAALPGQMYATLSSLIAVLPTEPVTSAVFDVRTRQPRFAPLLGKAEPLGEELLLVASPNEDSFRVVRVRDGAPLAPWEQSAAGARSAVLSVLVSPRTEAVAILSEGAPNRGERRLNALTYAVRGDSLTFVGQVLDIPLAALEPLADLQLADDGRAITDVEQRWSIAGAPASAQARPALPLERKAVLGSPLGQFEIQRESETDAYGTLRLVRRADGSVVERFNEAGLKFRFSRDDRWLAIWDKERIEVLDLERGEVAFTLNDLYAVRVDFAAKNTILNVHVSLSRRVNDDEIVGHVLVPLDGMLMERFANWLVPRELTPEERCLYGFGETDCLTETVTP